MDMSPRQSTAALLCIGVIVSLVALLTTPPHGTETWLGFAAVYLVTAILLGGAQLSDWRQDITPQYAIATAVLTTLTPVALRALELQNTRPELAITDMGFILTQFHVLLPFIIAFMAPLGVARAWNWQVVVVTVILAPFVGLTITGLTSGWGFGPAFVVFYYALLLIIGGIAGLPLYIYGRNLRDYSPPQA